MLLSEFLENHSISVADFAKQIGVRSKATVYRYLMTERIGNRLPAPDVMKKIYVATNGQVTANDFYDLPKSAQPIRSESTASQ